MQRRVCCPAAAWLQRARWTRALLVGTGLMLAACSAPHTPAPVVTLNSQPEPQDFHYAGDTYTVEKGDTLFAIAWYANQDYQDLARYNNLSPPYNIHPGQQLRLTPPQTARVKAPAPVSAPPKKAGPTTPPPVKKRVDRPAKQAYGESENNVNNQSVTPVKKASSNVKKSPRRQFPDRVKHWVWPAQGKVTSTFSRNATGRKGIAISAARGTSVKAAADGKVVYAGNGLRGYGNLIIIKHTDSFLSAYAHNDSLAVEEQQWVSAGQKIGTMGNSGTDLVKLHFEVRYRGKSLDPLRYLPTQ